MVSFVVNATIVIVAIFFIFRKKRKTVTWGRLFGGTCHRCAVCRKTLTDKTGGGFFQDYVCPKGHYEFHFDSGHFDVRVFDKNLAFRWEERFTNYDRISELAKSGGACTPPNRE